MLKRLLLPLLLFFSCAIGAAAQEAAEDSADTNAVDDTVKKATQQLEQRIDEHLLQLEKRVYDQNELGLRRLEHVEGRIDASQRHIERLGLILALSMLVIFLFLGSNLKTRQKNAELRLRHATQDAENLMKDIQREIARPEMQHLHISQILRRLLRQLRDQNKSALSPAHISEVREASNDPYLPVSLYLIARILVAEHDGSWNTAIQMLEQLREMDSKDPDVLLHLSHVHKSIAEKSGNVKVRARHQRLSYQYYAQFTATMQAEGTQISGGRQPVEALPAASADAEYKALKEVEAEAEAAAEPEFEKTTPPPKPAAVPPPVAAAPKQHAPAKKAASPPPASDKKPVPAAADKTTPPAATRTTAPQTTALANAPQSVSTTVVKTPLKHRFKNKLTQVKNINPSSIGKTLSAARRTLAKTSLGGADLAINGAANLRKLLSEKEEGPLPFLPVPSISDIPKDIDEHKKDMWQEIHRGDTIMAKATEAKSLRERNRRIDAAMTAYAQAQAHSTNKTLYQNWGMALLAKALHVPEKKRAPFYNAAVDKFLAGNVVSPHYFDFHLASLYAIIGNKGECLKWLHVARDNGGLDVSTLKQAPDFDSVRHEPWFDEFLQS